MSLIGNEPVSVDNIKAFIEDLASDGLFQETIYAFSSNGYPTGSGAKRVIVSDLSKYSKIFVEAAPENISNRGAGSAVIDAKVGASATIKTFYGNAIVQIIHNNGDSLNAPYDSVEISNEYQINRVIGYLKLRK